MSSLEESTESSKLSALVAAAEQHAALEGKDEISPVSTSSSSNSNEETSSSNEGEILSRKRKKVKRKGRYFYGVNFLVTETNTKKNSQEPTKGAPSVDVVLDRSVLLKMSSTAFETYAHSISSKRPLNPQEEKHLKAQRR